MKVRKQQTIYMGAVKVVHHRFFDRRIAIFVKDFIALNVEAPIGVR